VRETADLSSSPERSFRGTVDVLKYLDQGHLPDRLRITVKVADQPPVIADLPMVMGD
jgi:hypothetical protein